MKTDTMTMRANPESKFLLKYLLIGLACIAFALYAVFDGFVVAPRQLPRAAAWDELKADESLDDGQRDTAYKAIAEKNGWPSKRPGKPVSEINNFIIWQYFFMGIGSLVGFPCVIWYFLSRKSWVETTDNGLRNSKGDELEYDQITQFDKKKWEKKGIGVLTYQSKEGEQKFVLDDLKYERKTMDEIVRLVESKIAPELIVNGEPELSVSKPKARAEAHQEPASSE